MDHLREVKRKALENAAETPSTFNNKQLESLTAELRKTAAFEDILVDLTAKTINKMREDEEKKRMEQEKYGKTD